MILSTTAGAAATAILARIVAHDQNNSQSPTRDSQAAWEVEPWELEVGGWESGVLAYPRERLSILTGSIGPAGANPKTAP